MYIYLIGCGGESESFGRRRLTFFAEFFSSKHLVWVTKISSSVCLLWNCCLKGLSRPHRAKIANNSQSWKTRVRPWSSFSFEIFAYCLSCRYSTCWLVEYNKVPWKWEDCEVVFLVITPIFRKKTYNGSYITCPYCQTNYTFGFKIPSLGDKAHFHSSRRVNKPNIPYWLSTNFRELHKTPLYSCEVTLYWVLSADCGDNSVSVTTSKLYIYMWKSFFDPNQNDREDFQIQEFGFNETPSQLTLQDINWKLCKKYFRALGLVAWW